MKSFDPKWRPDEPVVDNAGRTLPRLAKLFFRQGRKACGHKVDEDELHQFRLAIKNFRYLLELFEPLYGAGLRVPLKQLRTMQTMLGDLNDITVTRRTVGKERAVLKYLDGEYASRIEQFREYWKRHFEPAAKKAQWLDRLSRPSLPARFDGKMKT